MIYNTYQELVDKLNELLKENKELKITLTKANRIIKDLQNRGDDKVNKDEIIKKYKDKIKKIYATSDDKELAHDIRDDICIELIKELGYEELADLLEKAEEDIGFWYA